MQGNGEREGAVELDSRSLIPYLDALFDRLDATSAERLHIAEVALGGVDFTIRCSNRNLLDRYLSRLVAEPPSHNKPALRIDVIAARELNWQPARWAEPDWQMHVFDQLLRDGGYSATYPYFEKQWIVRQHRSGNAVYFLDSVAEILPWDGGAPLRLPLLWAMSQTRRRMVHGGSLGVGNKGVLILGPGGAGKSGTTLAGLAAGLNTVGDDYLVLDLRQRPVARPLYRLLKQDPYGIARFPGLSDRFANAAVNWQGKYEFDPEELFPDCISGHLDLCAVLIPAIERRTRSELQPLPRAQAIRYLMTTTQEQSPAGSVEDLMFSAGLTSLPVYRLALSEFPDEIAASVRRVIETHAP